MGEQSNDSRVTGESNTCEIDCKPQTAFAYEPSSLTPDGMPKCMLHEIDYNKTRAMHGGKITQAVWGGNGAQDCIITLLIKTSE